MPYTPPAQPFVDNVNPVPPGVGNGQPLNANFFTALVAGVDDADTRITAVEATISGAGGGRAMALNLILGS